LPRLEYEPKSGPIRYTIFRQLPSRVFFGSLTSIGGKKEALLRVVWVRMEKKTILDRLDRRRRGVCIRGSGHFGREATYHDELSNSRTLGLIHRMRRSPLAHIVCGAPIQPVKDAAATRWFPFPPTPNAREPKKKLSSKRKGRHGPPSGRLSLCFRVSPRRIKRAAPIALFRHRHEPFHRLLYPLMSYRNIHE